MAYTTVAILRDPPYNLKEENASDDIVTAAILQWQQVIDRMTDQFFEPRVATVLVDGTDSDTLHFGVPIIDVTEMKINNSTIALDAVLFKVYTNRQAPNDDRKNPRIKLIRDDDNRDIFVSPIMHGRLIFRKGRQNQEITGTFGFTEDDGTTPFLIQRALSLLVIEKLVTPVLVDPANPAPVMSTARGPILEEVTDGHKLKYQAKGGTTKAAPRGLRGITENTEIHDIIRLYKAPLRMAAPANWSYQGSV